MTVMFYALQFTEGNKREDNNLVDLIERCKSDKSTHVTQCEAHAWLTSNEQDSLHYTLMAVYGIGLLVACVSLVGCIQKNVRFVQSQVVWMPLQVIVVVVCNCWRVAMWYNLGLYFTGSLLLVPTLMFVGFASWLIYGAASCVKIWSDEKAGTSPTFSVAEADEGPRKPRKSVCTHCVFILLKLKVPVCLQLFFGSFVTFFHYYEQCSFMVIGVFLIMSGMMITCHMGYCSEQTDAKLQAFSHILRDLKQCHLANEGNSGDCFMSHIIEQLNLKDKLNRMIQTHLEGCFPNNGTLRGQPFNDKPAGACKGKLWYYDDDPQEDNLVNNPEGLPVCTVLDTKKDRYAPGLQVSIGHV
jgi:hypothetical protein